MKFIALVSGGKDSIYSMLHAIRNGHTLLGCLHMASPSTVEEESYMYQTAASSTVQTLVVECLQVPLILYERKGKSIHTGLVYDGGSSDHHQQEKEDDEVEDLYHALQQAMQQFPQLQAVCSGAILSTYQRMRIENVCSRLGLTSISYLWRLAPQRDLLKQMLEDGIEAVLVKTACPPGLVPRRHLNQSLRYLWDSGLLERLHQRYQFHVCGEGGEYESMVLDSPLHKKKLVLDEVEIVENDDDDDGVGELRILSCHAQDKDESDITILSITYLEEASSHAPHQPTSAFLSEKKDVIQTQQHFAADNQTTQSPNPPLSPPHVHHGKGGLLHVSEIMASSAAATSSSSSTSEAELAVQEAQEIFAALDNTLQLCHATPQDVVFVHLYLSEMSHFADINTHYQAFFGSLLPPSRSCVAVGNKVLPGGRRVLLDCMVQLGSGAYMRSINNNSSVADGESAKSINVAYAVAAHATTSSRLREVLHVQSISYWAPVCVGPYSQTNTIRSGIQFLAGQIGLLPSSMALQETWDAQLEQCWKNVAAVLDALNGGSLKDICGSLIYVAASVYNQTGVVEKIASITTASLATNGSIVPGRVDALEQTESSELYGGYEDEGTWKEMKKSQDPNEESTLSTSVCPTLVVCIPEMPKGALVEVEVITATADASKYLDLKDSYGTQGTKSRLPSPSSPSAIFDTGHDFPTPKNSLDSAMMVDDKCCNDLSSQADTNDMAIDAFARVLGHGCAALAVSIASQHSAKDNHTIELGTLLNTMMTCLETTLANARSGLTMNKLLHLRLFYVSADEEDGVALRAALAVWIGARFQENAPATTVVPVMAVDSFGNRSKPTTQQEWQGKYAMQALFLDPVHLETEIWINKDRHYAT
jgi:diphthine-ammonia ligase